MGATSPVRPQDDQRLFTEILTLAEDPYKFCMFAFPWGQENTPLARYKGPRNWQREDMEEMADAIRGNRRLDLNKKAMAVFKKSTVSGRGPGKSALLAMLTHWMRSCLLGSTCIVTANTEDQLKNRTFAEIGKWNTLAINSHWFDVQALSIRPQAWFDHLLKSQLKIDTKYYGTIAQLWNEDNPDAFAGAHNHYGMMVLFDEASGIPTPIWKVTEGFFTDPVLHRYWLAYSNGRRNTGAFFETHHRDRDYWRRRQLDSRTVEDVDQEVYASIIRQYGEDSDEARVEVKGQFPRQGDRQFISREIVQQARERGRNEDVTDPGAALVMSIDVARFGPDNSVIGFRQGRDARTRPRIRLKGLDVVQLANRAAEQADRHKPDAIVCDGNGVGGGVVDLLKAMGYNVFDIQVGGKADDPLRYANKRAECYGGLQEWLVYGCIEDDDLLADDLTGMEYEFTLGGQIKLESKEAMKKRGLASPDDADMLALTFARKWGRRDMIVGRGRRAPRVARDLDYPLFG